MTIRYLIAKVNEEKPNTFNDEKLISFINEVEADVAEELHTEHFDYDINDMDTELLVARPYDRLYVSYLKAMIDYANEEYASYQLNQEQFTTDFELYCRWVVRTEQVDPDMSMPSRFRNVLR